MHLSDPGEPWTAADAHAVGRVGWVQVGALTRADFPPDVLAVLARDRRIALDGQALVRPAASGELVPDADFDPSVLRNVAVLKLSESEAEMHRRRGRGRRARSPRGAADAGLARRACCSPPAAASRSPSGGSRAARSDRRRRRLPRRLRVGARGRPPAALGRPPRRDDGRACARGRGA